MFGFQVQDLFVDIVAGRTDWCQEYLFYTEEAKGNKQWRNKTKQANVQTAMVLKDDATLASPVDWHGLAAV